VTQDFDTAFAAFMQGVKRITSNDPAIRRVESDIGARYIRVVQVRSDYGEGDRRWPYCFVDRANGEVLSGSWKAPRKTKKSRGNIFDASNGLGSSIA
jgi:hypothetical protein